MDGEVFKTMKDLSVILVNWNGRHLLEKALPLLPETIEIWVVDNASHDGSVSWLKQYYPEIHLIENKENLGFGRANNQALEKINNEFVLLLNTDAFLLENSLEIALNFLKKHPKTAILGAQLLHPDGRLQHSVSPRIDLWTECFNRKCLAWFRKEKTRGFSRPSPVFSVIGAAMLCRHCFLKEIGFFDEDYFFFFEETDLCKRLHERGFEIWHHPNFLVEHAQGQSAGKVKNKAKIEFHLSRELYFYKHFGREEAKTLHLWQERKLFLSRLLNRLGHGLTLGLWTSSKAPWQKALCEWYLMGCPANAGLRPAFFPQLEHEKTSS
jgi:GT2 family glycosyltransferase